MCATVHVLRGGQLAANFFSNCPKNWHSHIKLYKVACKVVFLSQMMSASLNLIQQSKFIVNTNISYSIHKKRQRIRSWILGFRGAISSSFQSESWQSLEKVVPMQCPMRDRHSEFNCLSCDCAQITVKRCMRARSVFSIKTVLAGNF